MSPANLAVAFSSLTKKSCSSPATCAPQHHKSFAVSTERGLSDFLAKGKNVGELDQLVQIPASRA